MASKIVCMGRSLPLVKTAVVGFAKFGLIHGPSSVAFVLSRSAIVRATRKQPLAARAWSRRAFAWRQSSNSSVESVLLLRSALLRVLAQPRVALTSAAGIGHQERTVAVPGLLIGRFRAVWDLGWRDSRSFASGSHHHLQSSDREGPDRPCSNG